MDNLKKLNKECKEDVREEEKDRETYEKDLESLSQEEVNSSDDLDDQEILTSVDKSKKRKRTKKSHQDIQEVYNEEKIAMAQIRQFERFRKEGILRERVMSQTNNLVLVAKSLEERARRVLSERVNSGENVDDILRVNDSYYKEKILKGLVPMTDLIYCRIIYPEEMK